MAQIVTHVEHSPSSAYRWMACPGSIALIRQAPPELPNRYAAEGTAAHALLHECYVESKPAAAFVGRTIDGFEVTGEMAEAVQIALDFYASETQPGDIAFVEQHIDLSDFGAPVPASGTADFVRYRPATGHLLVADFKYGKGIAVEVERNSQLYFYALGACAQMEKEA